MRKNLLHECETIYQNCLYSAETHHILAADSSRLATWLQAVPASVAAASSAIIIAGVWSEQQTAFAVLSAVTAGVAAVASIINPTREYFDHLNAAKNFTALKQDARSLKLSFADTMTDGELAIAARVLHDRYNELVKFTPATRNDKAFKKAQAKIKSGDHDLDEVRVKPARR